MASAHRLEESSMIVLLTYGGRSAVRALLETPEKITTTIAVFSENWKTLR